MKRARVVSATAGALAILLALVFGAASGRGQQVRTVGDKAPYQAPGTTEGTIVGPSTPNATQAADGTSPSALAGAANSGTPGASGASGGTGAGGGAGGRGTTSTSQRRGPAPSTTQPAAPGQTGARVAGPLGTVGNRVVDAHGNPVLLRGIQRIGLQSPGTWPAITDAEIGHAQAWGANIIRLSLSEAFSNPQCPTQYRPNYFDAVDDAVNSVTSRGMVALLELSYVTRVPCGQPDRWGMADRPVSIPFWRTVATRYGANPLVAFDLFNEPHGISDDQWRNGGEVIDWSMTGSTRWTAAGMQELYNAVRSTGATNLITISGTDWSANPRPILDGNAVSGSNLVYGLHAYTCPDPDAHPWCTSNPGNDHARIDAAWTRVGAHSPVMITEFGWPDSTDGAYNASVINAARAQNWGWIAFAWTGKANDVFGLVADLNTYRPTASGAPVLTALRSPR